MWVHTSENRSPNTMRSGDEAINFRRNGGILARGGLRSSHIMTICSK